MPFLPQPERDGDRSGQQFSSQMDVQNFGTTACAHYAHTLHVCMPVVCGCSRIAYCMYNVRVPVCLLNIHLIVYVIHCFVQSPKIGDNQIEIAFEVMFGGDSGRRRLGRGG